MHNRLQRTLQLSLVLLDFIAINIIYFTLEFLFRQNGLSTPNQQYVLFISILNIFWLAIAWIINIYDERYIASFEHFTKVSVQAFIYFVLLVVIFLFFFRMILLSRIFILVVLGCISFVLLINRILYVVTYHYFKKGKGMTNKVLIIGYNSLSKRLVEYLAEDGLTKEIIGYCEESENVDELSKYPILSNIGDAMDTCLKYGATEVYSTIAPEQNPRLYQLIQTADENCIRFKIVPDLGFFFKKQMHIHYLKEIPIISLRNEPLEDYGNRIKKRIIDIVISSFVLLFILSWLIPLVSLLIFFESKGPVFFAQLRTGKNNRNFRCLKFRSMINGRRADAQQACRDDQRITKIGKFLRRTSLDEFPQFLNVLKGDMSIVGPRPHMLKHTDQYSKLIGKYMVRQFLKPGITGWAQVNGYRGETRNVRLMQKRVEHDLWYMENWNLFLDFKIIFLTASHVLKGDKNAY